MSNKRAWSALTLGVVALLEGTVDPAAGAGVAAPIGSPYSMHGAVNQLSIKTGAADTAWSSQNLTGLRVFNVKEPTYGAKGDGTTDDTAAINAAIAACNTAGGGIVYFPPGNYKATKNAIPSGLAEYVSFFMDNVQNIVFLGDGNASKIVFSDNTGGTFWDGFYARNGSSNLSWRDLAMDGTAMVSSPANSVLIQITSQAPDANLGMHDFAVQGCKLGPSTGTLFFVDTTDVGHLISGIRVTDSYLDGTSSVGVGTGATGLSIINYIDRVTVSRNHVVGGAAQVAQGMIRVAVNATNNTAWDWKVTSNHGTRTDDPGVANALIASDGALQAHNIVTSATAGIQSGTSFQPYHLAYGNIVVQSGAITQPTMIAGQHGANGVTTVACANVVVRTAYTAAQTSVINIQNASFTGTIVVFEDNIAESGSTGINSMINVVGPLGANVNIAGNISVSHDTQVTQGSGQVVSIGATDGPVVATIVGNLTVVAAGNPLLNGVGCAANAGSNTRLVNIRANMALGTIRMANISQGTRSQWIGAMLNNHSPTNATIDINPPAANAGFTAGGNAGGSPQLMVSGGAIAGNVSASKGSVGFNTAGGVYTGMQYKETDDGTPAGGTAGWLGAGGGNYVFGAKNANLTAAARYWAMGMGLLNESSVEIQYAVHRACIVRTLRYRCSAGTGSGTVTLVVRKNGVNTAITTGAINNTATSGTDTTNSVAFATGDLISFQDTKAGTITTSQTNCRAVLEAA